MILAIHINRIDAINCRDRKSPAATWWDLETVIDDEAVKLLMYIVYISLMVYY
jgi:hypothetical protein